MFAFHRKDTLNFILDVPSPFFHYSQIPIPTRLAIIYPHSPQCCFCRLRTRSQVTFTFLFQPHVAHFEPPGIRIEDISALVTSDMLSLSDKREYQPPDDPEHPHPRGQERSFS